MGSERQGPCQRRIQAVRAELAWHELEAPGPRDASAASSRPCPCPSGAPRAGGSTVERQSRLKKSDGGLANTEEFNNFVVTLDSAEFDFLPRLGIHLGYRFLHRSRAGVAAGRQACWCSPAWLRQNIWPAGVARCAYPPWIRSSPDPKWVPSPGHVSAPFSASAPPRAHRRPYGAAAGLV